MACHYEFGAAALDNAGNDEGDVLGFRRPTYDNKLVARMPVSHDAMFYNMNHKKRGLAVIFNHEYFEMEKLKPRSGTDVDARNLKAALTNLGFEVIVHQDFKTRRILDEVQKSKYIGKSYFFLN